MGLNQKQQEEIFRFGHRARIWTLLHLNPNRFFTVEEISQQTRLAVSTVLQGLKLIRKLPLIETRQTYEMGHKIERYGFVPAL